MEKLTNRQQAIYKIITSSPKPIGTAEIERQILTTYDLSRDTLNRELKELTGRNLIKSSGSGPATAYLINSTLLEPIDPTSYFSLSQDKRVLTRESNADFFDKLASTDLLPSISSLNKKITAYRKKVADLPTIYHEKELERFTVDFAWKSSEIEGNTYSQIETETLLKYRQKAAGHSEAEAIMIINHKATFDFVRENLASFRKLNVSDIVDVHRSLVLGLNVPLEIRKMSVKISGTNYTPVDNPFTLRENLVRAADIINRKTNPIEKALVASALIIYLQPFADGNKRTARTTANAILMAHNVTPISYRTTDDDKYKKSVLLLDEQHNLNLYREMFLESLEFSVENYEV
jgi:Fic family protein